MPNDARLGLVVGVTLVILFAVLFARKDGPAPLTAGAQTRRRTSRKSACPPRSPACQACRRRPSRSPPPGRVRTRSRRARR